MEELKVFKVFTLPKRDATLPDNVVKVVSKELRRLKKMSPQMPEYPMLRHYLELIADLPWNKSSNEKIDIRKAKTVTFEPL
jgi:ATP-dependent Lon protease